MGAEAELLIRFQTVKAARAEVQGLRADWQSLGSSTTTQATKGIEQAGNAFQETGKKAQDATEKAGRGLRGMASDGWYANHAMMQLGRTLMHMAGPLAAIHVGFKVAEAVGHAQEIGKQTETSEYGARGAGVRQESLESLEKFGARAGVMPERSAAIARALAEAHTRMSAARRAEIAQEQILMEGLGIDSGRAQQLAGTSQAPREIEQAFLTQRDSDVGRRDFRARQKSAQAAVRRKGMGWLATYNDWMGEKWGGYDEMWNRAGGGGSGVAGAEGDPGNLMDPFGEAEAYTRTHRSGGQPVKVEVTKHSAPSAPTYAGQTRL
jgi:hypothetical protein